MSTTSIEWATHVWNPVIGCDRVSPGCAHCYALELAPRLRKMQQARGQRDGVWATQVDGGPASGPAFATRIVPERLSDPLRWRKPRMVFVNSMSDLFHDAVPTSFIDEVFDVMRRAPQHTFQVLTKRPDRMRDYLRERSEPASCVYAPWWPLPHVWLGVSIENRRYVGRADILRSTPAAVRFVSAEPLLGPLLPNPAWPGEDWDRRWWDDGYVGPGLNVDGIDWVIAGGESGPGHRSPAPSWVRALRDECRLTRTPFFLKQWGGRTSGAGGRVLDGRTWDELPTGTT